MEKKLITEIRAFQKWAKENKHKDNLLNYFWWKDHVRGNK